MVQTGNSTIRRRIFQSTPDDFVPGCKELRIPLGLYAALFTIEKIALGTMFEMVTIEQTGFTIFCTYLMDIVCRIINLDRDHTIHFSKTSTFQAHKRHYINPHLYPAELHSSLPIPLCKVHVSNLWTIFMKDLLLFCLHHVKIYRIILVIYIMVFSQSTKCKISFPLPIYGLTNGYSLRLANHRCGSCNYDHSFCFFDNPGDRRIHLSSQT